MTYLQFAFQSFWIFCGCFTALCIVVFMVGNLTWRLAYLLVVLFRGWPKNAPDGPAITDTIDL